MVEEKEEIRVGRVYKLTAEGCEKCYIGSTKAPYLCIRMAHHRERHRKGRQDFKGLFDNGDPNIEVVQTMDLKDGEGWKLRRAEQAWAQMNAKNCINIRRPYVSPSCRKIMQIKRVKRYHESPKGKIALQKAGINQRLKSPNLKPYKRTDLLKRLEDLCEQQRVLNAASSGGVADDYGADKWDIPAFPPLNHQDQSV
jgi:hypothetical protein